MLQAIQRGVNERVLLKLLITVEAFMAHSVNAFSYCYIDS